MASFDGRLLLTGCSTGAPASARLFSVNTCELDAAAAEDEACAADSAADDIRALDVRGCTPGPASLDSRVLFLPRTTSLSLI